jgi:hypothetical protein
MRTFEFAIKPIVIENSLTTMSTIEATTPALDLIYVRSQFPSLPQTVNGHPAAFDARRNPSPAARD